MIQITWLIFGHVISRPTIKIFRKLNFTSLRTIDTEKYVDTFKNSRLVRKRRLRATSPAFEVIQFQIAITPILLVHSINYFVFYRKLFLYRICQNNQQIFSYRATMLTNIFDNLLQT